MFDGIAPEPLKLRHLRFDGFVVAEVGGEVDVVTAADFRKFLLPLFDEESAVVVDLTGVTFFGSEGLAVLVDIGEHAERTDGCWLGIVPSRAVRRTLRAAGVTGMFAAFRSINAAVNFLRGDSGV